MFVVLNDYYCWACWTYWLGGGALVKCLIGEDITFLLSVGKVWIGGFGLQGLDGGPTQYWKTLLWHFPTGHKLSSLCCHHLFLFFKQIMIVFRYLYVKMILKQIIQQYPKTLTGFVGVRTVQSSVQMTKLSMFIWLLMSCFFSCNWLF